MKSGYRTFANVLIWINFSLALWIVMGFFAAGAKWMSDVPHVESHSSPLTLAWLFFFVVLLFLANSLAMIFLQSESEED